MKIPELLETVLSNYGNTNYIQFDIVEIHNHLESLDVILKQNKSQIMKILYTYQFFQNKDFLEASQDQVRKKVVLSGNIMIEKDNNFY